VQLAVLPRPPCRHGHGTAIAAATALLSSSLPRM